MKFKERVELQTLLVMFKASKNILPENLQKMFSLVERESRSKGQFKHQYARTTEKQMCTSVKGVLLWESVYNDIKQYRNVYQLKKVFKEKKGKLYESL